MGSAVTADEKQVITALKAYARLARMLKYSGCIEDFKLSLQALEAWRRLQDRSEVTPAAIQNKLPLF